MHFNEHQVALWKCKADVQVVIDFYLGEIEHRAYADGRGGYGPQWPEERMAEHIRIREDAIESLKVIQNGK